MENLLAFQFAHERRWVAWRSERVGDRITKVPYQPNGRKASVTDPATWSTLPEVARAKGFDGIGIVITHPLLAVDLDGVIEGGRIADAASAAFVERAESYTEVSPSGRGLHVFLLLSAPMPLVRNRSGQYEVYTGARYMTVTGASWRGEVRPLRTVTPAEAESLLEILGYPWGAPSGTAEPAPWVTASDEELLARIMSSRQAAKARALLRGDATGYRSQSEADQALCCLLAWWTRDARQIERIWLASAAGAREKVQRREDYRRRTIARALSLVRAQALSRAEQCEKAAAALRGLVAW